MNLPCTGEYASPNFILFLKGPPFGPGRSSRPERRSVKGPLRVAVLFFLTPKTGRAVVAQPRAALDMDRLTLYLAAHRHRNEVVARPRHRRRATAEPAASRIAASGDPDELGNVSEKRLVDRRFPARPTWAATSTGTRTRCSRTPSASGTWRPRSRRLRRTGDEPVAWGSTTPEPSKATTTTHELRLDARQLSSVATGLRHRVDDEVDALHVSHAIATLRRREWLRLGSGAEVPVRTIDRRTGRTRCVHDRNRVSSRARNRELHGVAHTSGKTVCEL